MDAHECLQMCVCGNSPSSCGHIGTFKKSCFVQSVPNGRHHLYYECVSVNLQDWLFQMQLAVPRNDGHLVLHVETYQVSHTQKHLITGPHLVTQTTGLDKDHNDCACVFKKAKRTSSPVHVDQQAAGAARCLPPSHWVHTDQRQSCSLSPGNPHCRWEVTLPASFLTWGEKHKATEKG